MSIENPFETAATVAPDAENITSEETDTEGEEFRRLGKMLSSKGDLLSTEETKRFKELPEEEQKKVRARYKELKDKLGNEGLKSSFLKGK